MSNFINFNNQSAPAFEHQGVLAKNFITNVFSWMSLALTVTGLVAYLFGTDLALLSYLIDYQGGGMTIFGWVVMLAPIGLVMAMGLGFQRFSYSTLVLLFAAYAILMGMSLGFIFLMYTAASIFKTFFITAGVFGLMAFLGYTTKTDLTKFGSFLYMALFGIIIASLVNFFTHSGTLDYIISIGGVLIFTGLTAYDVQKLKRIGAGLQYESQPANKLVLLGALSLYLDFINLFLFLLRFMGDRK